MQVLAPEHFRWQWSQVVVRSPSAAAANAIVGFGGGAHILETTKALALKVDSSACKNIRN
jgi:hypothetical protein